MKIGQTRRMVALAALFACALPLQAKTLDALGANIDLPFEFKVLHKEESRGVGQALAVTQRHELEVVDADGAKRKVMVAVTYVAPDRIANATMEKAADEAAVEDAGKPGVRQSADFRSDGFSFHFIDGPLADNTFYPQRMAVSGVINGALYRLAVLAADTRMLTPALAERIKAVRLDYAGLLKVKSAFEEEAKLAVQDGTLDTPLSRLRPSKGTQARLTYTYLRTDGVGEPVARLRSFGLFKEGFITLQTVQLIVGCGRADGFDADYDPRDFLLMKNDLDEEDDEPRYFGVTSPVPATLLGLPGEMATARGARPVRKTEIHRWLVRHDGSFYQVGIERINGSPVEKLLLDQLQSAPPMCQLGLQFGARP